MSTALPLALDDLARQRAVELDALSAILPFDRRDQLALLLTADDIQTLKHLAEKGMGAARAARAPALTAARQK